jgi:hypothetical protein
MKFDKWFDRVDFVSHPATVELMAMIAPFQVKTKTLSFYSNPRE